MHDAVEDRVREGRLSDQVVPNGDRKLARDERRAQAVPVLHDLKYVPSFVSVELREAPVVDHEKIGFGDCLEEDSVTAVPPSHGKFLKES